MAIVKRLMPSGAALALAWLLALSVPAADMEAAGVVPSRGRVTALLTALFYHDSSIGETARFFENNHFSKDDAIGTVVPRQALGGRERAKVVEFANSLVFEGGYFPKEIYHLLGYDNPKTARIARLTRQLDRAERKSPAPWEVAGRVGRSAMSGSSDHWAMAVGGEDDLGVSSPGTLAYIPALSIVYSAYPLDGREAVSQLAVLKDDDIRAAPVARSAFSLLARILVSERHDKDAWLRAAAADSGDGDTEHDLRAVRIKDWRYLRGEECAMGRLERAVYLWYKGESYAQIMGEARTLLRSRESLAYLAALSAATYGMEGLPKTVIASGANDKQLLEMVNDLHDLAISEAVLRVESESESNG